MNNSQKIISVLIATLLLDACATIPNGPSTMALPGTGKSFDQFQVDDHTCRQFAQEQIGGTTANQASNDSFAKTAILGTALGTAIGAAAGGGRGAGVGAATGLAMGSMVGAGEANASGYNTQTRYDNAYTQCMYAKGHQVAVSGRVRTQMSAPPVNSAPPNVPPNYMPPPPPPNYRP
jgi:outer membrane lipoprotein SlyB